MFSDKLSERFSERFREQGVTLIELIVAIVVISIAAASMYGAMAMLAGHSSDPLISEQAAAIADAYMEEISSKAFVDPSLAPTAPACSGPVESRANMNNICDYNGLNDIGAHDEYGNAIPSLSAYNVAVTVVNPASAWQGIPATDVLRIDIQVSFAATAQNYQLTAIRTRY